MERSSLVEITLRGIILAIVLALILAVANTYLALKIGILTSASIPAAIISMGILRFFKNSSIYENNLVQTAASAGEAIAGGVVYTVPALIIIRYWYQFGYWPTFFIALSGGVLGVLFSVPIRRVLVQDKQLPFPEGKAIAEVLRVGAGKAVGLRQMLIGSGVGALLELAQAGLKIVATNAQIWFIRGGVVFGFGSGFSATLVGAGYLIGFNVALSIFIGALIAHGLGVPVLSILTHTVTATSDASALVRDVYSGEVRYIGIGAMLVAGLWTLTALIKPFYESLQLALQAFTRKQPWQLSGAVPRTEYDIPAIYVLSGIFIMLVFSYFLFNSLFNMSALLMPVHWQSIFVLGGLLYVLIIGFIFSAICGYFSGLVGVSASPGSAVIIAGMLLAALLIRLTINSYSTVLSSAQLLNAAAITIMVGAVITGAACIANDNIQDLKVGHIIGSTPWKQQIMLLLGAIVSAAIVPPVMNLLFNVYGIADVLPHANMDPTETLAAPPAAMMASIANGVFKGNLPWPMLATGAVIILVCQIFNAILKRRHRGLSLLGIAIGIYLPLSSSTPLFIGGIFALITQHLLNKQPALSEETKQFKKQRGLLLACGLVAGAALMDVILAIPMSLAGSPDALAIMPAAWSSWTVVLGVVSVVSLGVLFGFAVKQSNHKL